MDFKYWYNNIADMPEQDENGDWYDLETGLYFKTPKHLLPKKEKKISKKNQILIEEVKEIQNKDWKTVSQEEKQKLYQNLYILRKNKIEI